MKDMGLVFSVITCTWNSADYLPASINSVVSQDYPHIEYIFVDGGSDDGTLDLIQRIPREVKCVTSIRGGISRAMNQGIELATGDVIAHLHSDDYYLHPQVLSRVAQALETSGAQWCFGRIQSDIDGRLVPEGYEVPRYSYARLLKGNFIPHPATFVRRGALDAVGGFDQNLRYAMDYDLWLRLGRLAVPAQLGEPLTAFRRHAGSLSTGNPLAALEEDYAVRMRYADRSMLSRAYHGAYYLARRRRLKRQVKAREWRA